MNDLGNKKIMANNLNKYMKISGKSRNDISLDLHIPYTTITAWLNAETYPRIDKIEILANYFGIDKSDLVEDEYKKAKKKAFGNHFANRSEALEFIMEQEMVATNDGYNLAKMTDEQILEFANGIVYLLDLADQKDENDRLRKLKK